MGGGKAQIGEVLITLAGVLLTGGSTQFLTVTVVSALILFAPWPKCEPLFSLYIQVIGLL